MIYKNILLIFMIVSAFISCNDSKTKKPVTETTKEELSYNFDAPKGWATEKISFPIDFASQIPYKGHEDIRFTPGWEFANSEEHWSYAFLWWLEGNIKVDTTTLNEYLENYYTGLLSINSKQRQISRSRIIQPAVSITKTNTEDGDTETFTGTITMLNYLDITLPQIVLNCVINKKDCKTHTAIIFRMSPQPLSHKVWQQLNQLESGFECK